MPLWKLASDALAPPKGRSWALWLLVLAGVAVLLWPWSQDGKLRAKASQRLLDTHWQPEYRILPLLSMAQARSGRQDQTSQRKILDKAWEEMGRYRDNYSQFQWLELSVLEYQAGRLDHARRALARAQALDARITDMIKGPAFSGYRQSLEIKYR